MPNKEGADLLSFKLTNNFFQGLLNWWSNVPIKQMSYLKQTLPVFTIQFSNLNVKPWRLPHPKKQWDWKYTENIAKKYLEYQFNQVDHLRLKRRNPKVVIAINNTWKLFAFTQNVSSNHKNPKREVWGNVFASKGAWIVTPQKWHFQSQKLNSKKKMFYSNYSQNYQPLKSFFWPMLRIKCEFTQ